MHWRCSICGVESRPFRPERVQNAPQLSTLEIDFGGGKEWWSANDVLNVCAALSGLKCLKLSNAECSEVDLSQALVKRANILRSLELRNIEFDWEAPAGRNPSWVPLIL